MKIRCKFEVTEVGSSPTAVTLKARAVMSDCEENKVHWGATPCGSLELHCVSPEILATLGIRVDPDPEASVDASQQFYLDIVPIKKVPTEG